jgi:hypothetical protein
MEENFQQQLQKQTLEAAARTIQDRIASLVCPDHGQSPRLKFSEDSGPGRQKMSFDCCCGTMARRLRKTLEG